MRDISRRRFIGRGAAAVAGLGLAGGGIVTGRARAAQGTETDLLIIGAGLAGLSAAVTAGELGVSAVLADKRYRVGGTGLGAGGSFSAAGSRMQRAKNIEDSPELHFADARRIGKEKNDPEILRLYTANAGAVLDWLENLGVEFDPRGPRMAPEHELYSVPRTCDARIGARGYVEVFEKHLERAVASGRVRLLTETSATSLVREGERVRGARFVDDDGREITIYARAVILATGGYGSNQEMIRKYNPSLARALKITSKYATGEGILMAERAGAALVNMDLLVPYFAGVENPPASGRTMFNSLISGIVPNFKGDIWVTKEGLRFMNEDSTSPDERERALRRIPDAALFALFDAAMLAASKEPLANFQRHLQEGRVVKTAATIAELAREFNLTPRTIRYYEDQGLLAPTRVGMQRIYSKRDRTRLKLTLRGKRLGLSLAEIRELLDMYDTAPESSQLTRLLEVLAKRRAKLEQQREDIEAVLAEVDALERQCRSLLAEGKLDHKRS